MNKIKTTLALLALGASSLSQANLINNGGFESPDIANGWTYLADSADGWQGDNIEVWASDFNGVTSYEGSQHGELNAHPYDATSWSIYQAFDTVVGAVYDVSFAYRARSNENEAFKFELFTGDVSGSSYDYTNGFNLTMDDHITSDWSEYASTFVGTGETFTLMFTSINPDAGTVGNFIDAVSVEGEGSVANVPEPGSLALIAMGVLGLAASRRRTSA